MTEWGYLYEREDWGALPPKWELKTIPTPVPAVVEDYDTGVEECFTHEDCKQRTRELQQKAFDEGRPDIPYSFVIGGDGNIYEGRGWHTQVTEPHDWDGICIGYLGHFSVAHIPRLAMSYCFVDLIKYGKENNFIQKFHERLTVNKYKKVDEKKKKKVEKIKEDKSESE